MHALKSVKLFVRGLVEGLCLAQLLYKQHDSVLTVLAIELITEYIFNQHIMVR